jgi:hypothetical protein
MVTQYLINDAWQAVSLPGKSITAYLDEQEDGAVGSGDCRIICSETFPTDADFTKAKKVYKPTGNKDTLPMDCAKDNGVFYARCSAGGVQTLCVTYGGSGEYHSVDVSVQDPINPFSPGYFTNSLGTALTASIATIDTNTVTLATGHGFTNGTAGQVLVVEGYYIGKVLTVTGDVITVDTPFGYTFPVGTTVVRGDILLNRDGSVTRLVYSYRPIAGRTFDTKEVRIGILDSTVMGDALFGGGTARTKGMVLRVKKTSGWYNLIANIKTNGDVRLFGTLVYSDKPPADKYGCTFKFSLLEEFGAIARIKGDAVQELQLIIQDNYADLDLMEGVALSHVVID